MKTLINRIKAQQQSLLLVALASIISIAFLSFRIKLTHSPHYLFLAWNLFLALIPLVISKYVLIQQTTNRIKITLALSIWLLFLPNAPYMVTDLYHIRLSHPSLIWLDVLVIGSFAISGLVIYYLSILDIHKITSRFISVKMKYLFLFLLSLITSFGIYLGRYLRFNSWELLSNPLELLNEIFNLTLGQPNKDMLLFTFGFGVFLMTSFVFLHQLRHSKSD